MRCRECGLEVDNDKAFCPVCGAPMKVTADYDYIQAEIANKVDRYFNEDNEDADAKSEGESAKESEVEDTFARDDDPEERDEMSKTRDVYGKDSIFDDDEDDEYDEEYDEREYDEDYDNVDDIEFDEDVRIGPDPSAHERRTYDRPSERPQRRPVSRTRRRKRKNQTAAKIITVLIIFVIIAAAVAGVMGILGLFDRNGNRTDQNNPATAKATLTSNLTAGNTYQSPLRVELKNELEGNIFYTLDGSEPSINSKMYTEPFDLTGQDVPASSYPEVNLRAVSYSPTNEKAGELNIVFSLEYDPADAPKETPAETEPETTTRPAITELSAPQISPESGDFNEDTYVTITSPEGATIYYTMDGTYPDQTSDIFTAPVLLPPGTTYVNAVCIEQDIISEVVSQEYNVDYGFFVTPDQALMNASLWLFANGYTIDYNFNTMDGYADVKNIGVTEIGDYTYYVVQADFYSDGTLQSTEYIGIGVNYGGGEHLTKNGNTYTYN